MKKEIYAMPQIEVVKTELGKNLMTLGSGNLPDGSKANDMGGGAEEEPFTPTAESSSSAKYFHHDDIWK